MLPSVGPGAVSQRVADLVMGDGHTIVSSQQVAPTGVTVGIAYRIDDCAGRSRCVGILRAAENVACIVVSPDPGLARCLIVFFQKLICGVVAVIARGQPSCIRYA